MLGTYSSHILFQQSIGEMKTWIMCFLVFSFRFVTYSILNRFAESVGKVEAENETAVIFWREVVVPLRDELGNARMVCWRV